MTRQLPLREAIPHILETLYPDIEAPTKRKRAAQIRALAARIGAADRTIYAWMHGEDTPNMKYRRILAQLARETGISIDPGSMIP